MELGTGIFLASVVMSLVILYVQTKDRWNWRKIFLRTLLGFIILVGGSTLLILAYSKFENRTIVQSEFLSIALGDKESDVRFKKGNPASSSVSDSGKIWLFNGSNNQSEIVIIFKDSAVKSVLYVGDCTYCNNISGLGVGTDYAEVKEKLGEPSSVSISSDQLERLASFEKWNLVFRLKENKVIAFGLYDSKLGPVIFSKEAGDKVSNSPSK